MDTPYTFSFLREQDIPELYETFLQAFADYFVPIKLNRREFDVKLKREGVQLSFCAGAYHNEKLVGFIMTGLGEWQGKPTAYNAGTGVLPGHRGHRLTQGMYAFMIPKLKESGIEQCLLEVIQQNEVAVQVYKTLGFTVTRSLDCFRAPVQNLVLSGEVLEAVVVRETAKPQWEVYAGFCNISPSWQHTKEAFKQNPDQKMVLEAYVEEQLVGFAAFFPRTGSVSQLAVQQGFRKKGVATVLLREVVKQTTAPALMMINVDTAGQELLNFLQRVQFERILGQYEMLLPLHEAVR